MKQFNHMKLFRYEYDRFLSEQRKNVYQYEPGQFYRRFVLGLDGMYVTIPHPVPESEIVHPIVKSGLL